MFRPNGKECAIYNVSQKIFFDLFFAQISEKKITCSSWISILCVHLCVHCGSSASDTSLCVRAERVTDRYYIAASTAHLSRTFSRICKCCLLTNPFVFRQTEPLQQIPLNFGQYCCCINYVCQKYQPAGKWIIVKICPVPSFQSLNTTRKRGGAGTIYCIICLRVESSGLLFLSSHAINFAWIQSPRRTKTASDISPKAAVMVVDSNPPQPPPESQMVVDDIPASQSQSLADYEDFADDVPDDLLENSANDTVVEVAAVEFQESIPGTSADTSTSDTKADVNPGARPKLTFERGPQQGSVPSSKAGKRKIRKMAVLRSLVDEGVDNQSTLCAAAKRPLSADSSLEQSNPKRPSVADMPSARGGNASTPKAGTSKPPGAPKSGPKGMASRLPQGAEATPPELIVIIDNQAADRGALSADEIELVRFTISTLILAMDLDTMGPEFGFTYSGFSNGFLSIHCKSAPSREFLMDNVVKLNEAFDGADLRARLRTDVPVPHRIAAFLPVPKKVDASFLTGLLIRQNMKLCVNRWDLKSAEFVRGKDLDHPMIGSGYWARFDVDDESLAALEDNNLSVLFATTVVKMKVFGRGTQKEVRDAGEDTDRDGVGV